VPLESGGGCRFEPHTIVDGVAALQTCPVQQAVRIEGVPDPHPIVEIETHGRAAFADGGSVAGQLFVSHAVLRLQVLARVGASGRHRRIQFEGLEVQLDRNFAGERAPR